MEENDPVVVPTADDVESEPVPEVVVELVPEVVVEPEPPTTSVNQNG